MSSSWSRAAIPASCVVASRSARFRGSTMRASPGSTSRPLGAITAPARRVVAAARAVASSGATKIATPSAMRRQPFGGCASLDALPPAIATARPSGARGLRDLLTSTRQIGRDAASFALAFAPLLRQLRGGGRELLIARKEGPLLVTQSDLVALSDQMRAFGLDTRGARFGEGDARSG